MVLLALAAGGPSAAPSTAATADPAAVRIGKKVVTETDFTASLAPALAAQERGFAAERARLELESSRARADFLEAQAEQLVDDRVLSLEAAARGTTRADVLAEAGIPTVTDADVERFYELQKAQIGQPLEAVAPAIRELLRQERIERSNRRLLDGLRVKYDAEVLRAPLRAPVAASGPSRGPAGAPVTVVEFGDFQCPYCARMRPVLDELLTAYPSEVRLVFRQLPLADIHPHAQKAAEASRCAAEQERFWPLHDALFADQTGLDEAGVSAKARVAGLDMSAFASCLESGRPRTAIAADIAAATELGLRGTPAFFVNGRFVNGAVDLNRLVTLVEDELRRDRLVRRSATALAR